MTQPFRIRWCLYRVDEGVVVDDGGFEEFVRARSAGLLRSAYLLCGGDPGAAEDLLQDVLERMYPKWRRISGDPEGYARAALANAAANRWRRKSRRVAEAPLELAGPRGIAGPEGEVTDRDLVVRALAALPPRTRAVLVLRFFHDLSEAQTAAALGCGVGTVKSQTSRGLARLRQWLPEQDGTFPNILATAVRGN
ncbi:SigE family RNA polymerase sigma factor [Phytohabitans aurantiacus]|jgi:RNA polymerase sigma-70 factor (sigma-E family)|uniref:DNA-directed RNA polymerase sigma-70 factor n=1 Tax=Phytohabitans aurantiacus TaxID=3016789 RepID=A0ABQ5R293_9ACTN|nr:SigE family RNA polymerase sigma factor [Phytohabitans aurantiacus]GLI00810.1 DNA-directed RNA polymerase sigma-70 factor [Phytohabitans aurantiacus]